MGTAKVLNKEINHYLDHLNTHQKEVVLSVVKTFAQEENECIIPDFITLLSHSPDSPIPYISLYLLGEFSISAFFGCRVVAGYTGTDTFVQSAQV